jgi:hypothetical protein
MHARIDELLRLRDGATVDARVRAHVDQCGDCAASLAGTKSLRERLRALPPAPALAADGWAELQAHLAVQAGRRRRLAQVAPFAAAASMAALALFGTLRGFDAPSQPAAESEPLVVLDDESVEELRARSQALDELLAAMPQRPAVARAGTSVPIETLQAEVQWLDHQLSLAGAAPDAAAPGTEHLWRDRVEVMDSLVRLRYVEAQYVAL